MASLRCECQEKQPAIHAWLRDIQTAEPSHPFSGLLPDEGV